MRRNASTVVVLAGPAPGEVLAALGQSMNVALIRPEEGTEGLTAAAEALQRAGRATSPYALVPADPLAAVAASWREMWDVSKQEGPAGFEQEAVKALAAWRAGRFELPDYYLVLAREDTGGPDFYLGPLRSARAHRVVLVPDQEPGQQAAGVLHALDPATGRTLEQVPVGQANRFATPAIYGNQVLVPTLTGVVYVRTS